MSRKKVMDEATRKQYCRNLEEWWTSMRERPLPVPGGSHSLALLGYELNREKIGFEHTQENLPKHDRVLVVSGGPGAKSLKRVEDAYHDFEPDAILATMSYFLNGHDLYSELSDFDFPIYLVDMEVDAHCLESYYPKGWTGTAIWNAVKMQTDLWCKPERVYWVNCAAGGGCESFNRDEIGPRIPYRTTGEVALYLACFKMGAKTVGTLGIQNPLPDYEKQRRFTLEILKQYGGEIVDYEGSGVIHEWLGGVNKPENPMDCTTCPHFLPTAPAHTRQGRCLVEECDRGVR